MYEFNLMELFWAMIATVIFLGLAHFLSPPLERLYESLVQRLHGKERLLDVSTRHGLDWRIPGIFKRPGFSGDIDHRRVEARLRPNGMIQGRVELSPGWYSDRYLVFDDSGRISLSTDELLSRGVPRELIERLRHHRIIQAIAPVAQTAEDLRIHKGALEFAVAYQNEEAAHRFFADLFHAAELLSQPPELDHAREEEHVLLTADSDDEPAAETATASETVAAQLDAESNAW